MSAITTKVPDGGPTFPGSLRDWFAGQALVGFASNPAEIRDGSGAVQMRTYKLLASLAYEMADAMLTARGEKP